MRAVSIPYRQSRIQKKHLKKWNIKLSFNSLQVVQNLVRINDIRVDQGSFNSLQVVQNPVLFSYISLAITQFQFLIGSLESINGKIVLILLKVVSIPYRQSRILITNTIGISISYSFNSLQVVQNRVIWIRDFDNVRQFQFLIGSLESRL